MVAAEKIRYYSDKQGYELSKINLKAANILFILALIYACISTFTSVLHPDKEIYKNGLDILIYNASISLFAVFGTVWCHILYRWQKIESLSVRNQILLYNSSIYFNMAYYLISMNVYFLNAEDKIKPLMGFGIIVGVYTLAAKISPYILSFLYISTYILGFQHVKSTMGISVIVLSFVYVIFYCFVVFVRAQNDKLAFERSERLQQINVETYQKYFEQIEINDTLQRGIIIRLADLIESRDGVTGEHTKRTSEIVNIIAKELAKEGKFTDILTPEYVKSISFLSMLHDVGKIKIPDCILNKPTKLTSEEFSEMKMHTIYGSNIINEVFTDYIEDRDKIRIAEEIAYYHHEWWNGEGYPAGLKRKEIPLHARIMAVADVYDALTSNRCYKVAVPYDKAFELIKKESGTHFDPEVVEAFVNAKTEILKKR